MQFMFVRVKKKYLKESHKLPISLTPRVILGDEGEHFPS